MKVKERRDQFQKAVTKLNDQFNFSACQVDKAIDDKETLPSLIYVGLEYNGQLDLQYPEDHSRDYERAIRMVELSVYERFSLTEHQFNQYVLNDWEWKNSFLNSTSMLYVSGYSAPTYLTGAMLTNKYANALSNGGTKARIDF